MPSRVWLSRRPFGSCSQPCFSRPGVLKAHGEPQHRAVLQHVELVAPAAFALRIVNIQGAITEEARERDATPGGEVELVSRDGLPGELAADVEAADVPTD